MFLVSKNLNKNYFQIDIFVKNSVFTGQHDLFDIYNYFFKNKKLHKQ